MNDRPLVTMGQVEQWRAKKAQLEQQISAAQAELAAVSRKLEAVTVFLAEEEVEERPFSFLEETTRDVEPMTSAMFRLIRQHPNGVSPLDLRRALIAEGVHAEKIKANPNYFYNILSRFALRGKAERLANGNYKPKGS